MKKIKWGVIAPGRISEKFSAALANIDSAVLEAVASRNTERADAYAKKWGYKKSYSSYEALFADKDIDAVYIASPNMNHHTLCIEALRAGKHVVCEKPAALNASMLRAVVAEAKKCGLFYMEAFWTKFLPAFLYAQECVKSGRLGNLQCITGNFFINRPYEANDRRYELSLGGGALVDIGIYAVTFALSIAASYGARFAEAHGFARINTDGIDLGESLSLRFEKSAFQVPEHEAATIFAQFSCAFDVEALHGLNDGYIVGSKGKIRMPSFWSATSTELYDTNTTLLEKKEFPYRINGFEYQIEEASRCIHAGLLETPLHTNEQAIECLTILDGLRSQWNISYPEEKIWKEKH